MVPHNESLHFYPLRNKHLLAYYIRGYTLILLKMLGQPTVSPQKDYIACCNDCIYITVEPMREKRQARAESNIGQSERALGLSDELFMFNSAQQVQNNLENIQSTKRELGV